MRKEAGHFGTTSVLLVVAIVALTSSCATKKFVRDEVSRNAGELTATMDQKDQNLRQAIESNTSQIDELGNKTAEQGRQIATLDTGLKATDQKAAQALSAGQAAQTAATQASTQVTQLDTQFKNRNHHTTVAEQSVPFSVGSATVPREHADKMDQVAQQVKGNADAILVLEGRTDSTGDENFNIGLGERRIESVVRYLVVDKEVPMQQIYTMSYGEAKPVAANDTREGRAQNRTVIMKVLAPNPAGGQMTSDASRQPVQ